jgi:multidrug transporter EmrE-like cation transporter
MNITFLLIMTSIFLNVAAQLLLKAAMNRVGEFSFSLYNVAPVVWKLMLNPFLIMGLFIYGISLCIWLLVLSRIDVSVAYPLISVGFIINALGAYYLLGEPLGITRIIGIIVIVIGVFLVTRTVS